MRLREGPRGRSAGALRRPELGVDPGRGAALGPVARVGEVPRGRLEAAAPIMLGLLLMLLGVLLWSQLGLLT